MTWFGILDRVLFWSVLQSILAVLAVICAIDFLFALLDVMGLVSESFTLVDALGSVLLQLPIRFIEFASVASLIGALVVLGVMASNAELVVMRAAGWSPLRILQPAMAAALVVSAVSLGLAEYVVPAAALHNPQQVSSDNGVIWLRDGHTFARADRITDEGVLLGLTLIEIEDQRVAQVRYADEAIFRPDLGHWQLARAATTRFKASSLEANPISQETWTPQATPQELQFIARAVESLSIRNLVRYIDYRREQGLDTRRYSLNLWKTLLQPIANIVMVLLASSLVFGSMRMVSMGYRVTVGLMFGLGFFYAQDAFGFVSLVYGVHPVIALSVPIAVFFCIALYRFRHSS